MRRRRKRCEPRRRTRVRKPRELTPAETKTTARNTTTRRTVALVPGIAAGTILTRAAGKVHITATLAPKPGTPDPPRETQNDGLHFPALHEDARWFALAAADGAPLRWNELASGDRGFEPLDVKSKVSVLRRKGEGGEHGIEVEVMAFDRESMGRAVEAVMRRISEEAAILDAILEMQAVRISDAKFPDVGAAAEMSRTLSEAGFPVSEGILWEAPPAGDVWVGVGENGEYADGIRDLLESKTPNVKTSNSVVFVVDRAGVCPGSRRKRAGG